MQRWGLFTGEEVLALHKTHDGPDKEAFTANDILIEVLYQSVHEKGQNPLGYTGEMFFNHMPEEKTRSEYQQAACEYIAAIFGQAEGLVRDGISVGSSVLRPTASGCWSLPPLLQRQLLLVVAAVVEVAGSGVALRSLSRHSGPN